MPVPRITLWSPPLQTSLRLAVRPFNDHHLEDQALKIHADDRPVRITPGTMYILSSIAGRRMPESVRWVLLDSLQEILDRELCTEQPERQDLLASTFGEVLGALFLALELGGSRDGGWQLWLLTMMCGTAYYNDIDILKISAMHPLSDPV
jgi:hypothetical protein